MFKSLLKVIPALSGNCKLSCVLNNYQKSDNSNDEFIATSRYGYIYPLSTDMHQKIFDISFLNSSWEYDVCKFYNSGYSDVFFKDTFSFDKNNLLKYNLDGNVVNDRNTNIEFGCKRISYIKTGKQLSFFAPFYCDNVNDLPDYFKIDITINTDKLYSIKKSIKVDLTENSKNYLNLYLKRYFSKIDDNVIYMMPDTKQAVYYGIDVLYGGFNKYKDNLISKIFTEETTINGYDACITNGFKRNNLIIRQIMPLAFMFSIDDILSEYELKQYRNSELVIKGQYYKNDTPLDFYILDDNYESLAVPVLKVNKNTGKLEYQYTNNNLLALNTDLCIRTDNAFEYRFSNKLNKSYNRWKLKYSSDEYPYITNTNYNFSKNQGLYNLYYEYPQNYHWSTLFCNVDDNEINLLLPFGDNYNNYYNNNNTQYLVNKYMLSLNNYINNWFDMTYSINIEDIVKNTEWGDVWGDNKIFYKGLLYDFNNMYKENIVTDKIDKFAILFYINDYSLLDNSNIENVVYSKHSVSKSSLNNISLNLYTDNGELSTSSSLYNLLVDDNTSYNMTIDTNDYFTYNSYGAGQYVELEDLGIDFYENNRYIDALEVKSNFKKHNINYNIDNIIITGYEYLPITYVNSVIYKNYNNDNIKCLLNTDNDNIYYCYNSTDEKIQLSKNPITDIDSNIQNEYIFLQKHELISVSDAEEILSNYDNITLDDFTNNYIYYPVYNIDADKTIQDVFVELDPHNKFYGNTTSYFHIDSDADVLYVDPYNIKDKLDKYYKITGNLYIKGINDTNIILGNLYSDSSIKLNTEYNNKNYKDEILELLDYNNTYFTYYDSEYKVNKYIKEINSIYIDKDEDSNITYNIELHDNIIANNIVFEDNYTIGASYITGYFYVNNIDLSENTITLSDYNSNTIKLKFDDEEQTKIYACYVGVMTYDNDIYIPNQNCIGTYMYKDSYIFTHPQNVIKKIYNITYSTISNSNNTITIENNDYKFEILSYDTDINYKDYNLTIHNEGIKEEDLNVSNIILSDNNTDTLYGRFMNMQHILLFTKYLKQYALDISDKEYEESNNINDYIFIKKTVLKDTDFGTKVRDAFIPISEVIGKENNIISCIENITNYLFKINYANNSVDIDISKVELYFKKNFIKINKQIYDNVISINTNNYKDLYIYRLLNVSDIIKDIKFEKNNAKTVSGTTRYTSSYSLTPLFDNVFYQKMEDTVIYKSYILNNITPVNYIDENRNVVYNLYRYAAKDKLYLVNVTDIPEFSNASTYILSPKADVPSFIYDTKSDIDAYTYISSKIPTYDRLVSITSEYINVVDNSSKYTDYKINTYTYNGVTYGFYLNSINIKNINNIFNISFLDYTDAKYFSKINGVSIINNHKYFTDMFKLIIPIIKYNMLNNLYSIPILNKQYKTSFPKKYKNAIKNIKNHIIYNKKNNNGKNTISLYRYYDNIIPNFIKCSTIYTEYLLKTTLLDKISFDTPIYREDSNIYNYKGIRVYSNNDTYETKKQLEYKYYNDSKFINLEPYFEIFIGNDLSYIDVIKYQENENIIKYFKNYINKYKNNKFSDTEILFLFNKYNIELSSVSEKLNDKHNNKIYSLTYKFNLK